MVHELEQVIEEAKALPPEDQRRLAAAMRLMMRQPARAPDEVQPEAMVAFEEVMRHSTSVLNYLKDR